jgi:glutaredoxin
MAKYTLITRDDCVYCTQAKTLLADNEISFTELKIGVDLSRDDVLREYPDQTVLPIVLHEDRVLGGYLDLMDHMFPPLDTTGE